MTESPIPFDPLALLLRRWKTVVCFVVLGAAAGLTYGFLAAKWYSATLTVVPSQRTQGSMAAALASKLPDAIDPTTTDVQRILAVLNSTSVADKVIDKFKLADVYDTNHPEHTREKLHDHCVAQAEKKSSVVSLTCEDKDPARAMAMAAYFGEVGNDVFRRISTTSAAEESRFLEGQVAKARKDVDESSKKLQEFQEQHKVIDLPEQAKAVISAMASVKGELMTKQLSLEYLSSFSSGSESSVVQLRQQIAILQGQLREMERASPPPQSAGSAAGVSSGSSNDFFPEAANVPNLRHQLEQLLRDQKIHETVFFLMTQRYENARADAARDTNTFQILDQPTMPTYKSRPKRAKMGLIGLLAGAVLAAAFVLGPVWIRQQRLKRA